MSNRTQFLSYPILLMISMFLFGCKTDKTQVDNNIYIRLKKEPERINPLIFPNAVAREVYQYIHLPLADYNEVSLELEPVLITKIPTEMPIDTGKYAGGVYFDVEILPDASWDDGSPITGNDFLFTVKAINLPSTNAGNYRELTQHISDIVVDSANPKTFRVIFSKDHLSALEIVVKLEMYPQYFYDSNGLLADYNLSDFTEESEATIQSDSTLTKFADAFNGTDFSRNTFSGAGPYKFLSWTADQNIILSKKENYWAKNGSSSCLRQGPDNIIFQIIPDEITALAQLKSGSLDVINEISADNYQALQEDSILAGNFSFYHPALIKQYVININNKQPILSDVAVRKALAHLMDVNNAIANLENNMAVRSVGPIHPLKKTFNNSLVPIVFSTDEALQILTEAGWKDTNSNGIIDKKINGKVTDLELEVLITGQAIGKNMALMLQESAKTVGIRMNIVEKDFKIIRTENLKTRKYDLLLASISQDINNWDDLHGKWHSESDTPDGSNHCSYHNAQVDEMIDKILFTKSVDQRIKLYQDIQAQIYADQPCIFLYAPEEKIVVSNKWKSAATAKRPGYMANTFEYINNAVFSNN